jgi:hypothetical protein
MIRDPAHWVRILGSAGRIDWLGGRRSHRPEIGANLSGELVMNSTEDPRADTSSDAGGPTHFTAMYLQQTAKLSNALIDMWSAWARAADVVSRERGLAVGKSLGRLFTLEVWKAGEFGPLLEELRQTLSLPQLADVPNLNLSAIDTLATTVDLIGLLQQYMSISLPLWLSATRQFQAEITARAKQGNGVKSPGEALDLWNGIVDRALMEFNRSGEFAKIQQRRGSRSVPNRSGSSAPRTDSGTRIVREGRTLECSRPAG